ncbi:hypothetical protein B0H12DRAFT_305256 [Mycena haematopus]|nr:hypothetical protein B0H12DRAFT_305256 [Mycena haematopus]
MGLFSVISTKLRHISPQYASFGYEDLLKWSLVTHQKNLSQYPDVIDQLKRKYLENSIISLSTHSILCQKLNKVNLNKY